MRCVRVLHKPLITEFERLTDMPVVLNTSFNLRGEPIVNTPDEAIADYLRSGMDALLLGRCLVEKEPYRAARAPGPRRRA